MSSEPQSEPLTREEAIRRLNLIDCAAIYTDGGCLRSNPSPIGGVWAWVAVDEHGERLAVSSGIRPATEEDSATNNLLEFIAAVHALEAVPAGWAGELCSDSRVTLGRLRETWTLAGIPPLWVKRGGAAIARAGEFRVVLLQGHPTQADLLVGKGARRGLPVSAWNVEADRLCREEARKFMQEVASSGQVAR